MRSALGTGYITRRAGEFLAVARDERQLEIQMAEAEAENEAKNLQRPV
jgi:hypothetical protein